MTDAKRPQDHKKPRNEARRVTVDGIELDIEPAALNDWELVESLLALQEDSNANAFEAVNVLRRILGADQYRRVKDMLRDDKGIVPADSMETFIEHLFDNLDPNS